MAIKQIGELGLLNTIPVNSQVVIENNNDANVVSTETLVTALGKLNIPELATTGKTIIDALNELNDRIKSTGIAKIQIEDKLSLKLKGKLKLNFSDSAIATIEEADENA